MDTELNNGNAYIIEGKRYTYDELVKVLSGYEKERERCRIKRTKAYWKGKNVPEQEQTNVPEQEQTNVPEQIKDLGNGSQSINGRITRWNSRPWVPISIPKN